VLLDGVDILPSLLEEHGDALADDVELPRRLLDELGAVPSYYLRYFYAHDAVLREQLDGTPRAEVVGRIEHELLDLYRDPTVVERPALLMQRGGAYYSEAALGLADDDVVEVPARVGRDGAVALAQRPLAPP